MIPQYAIQEWHEQVPWNADALVEQDLIISRAFLLRPDITFNPKEAYQTVYCELIDNMAGKRLTDH